MKKIAVLITTDKDKRGVFMGYIDEKQAEEFAKDPTKTTVVSDDTRMCVYWDQATKGVIGLAATGPTKGCRITGATPRARIQGVTAIMDITKEAEKAWLKEPWG